MFFKIVFFIRRGYLAVSNILVMETVCDQHILQLGRLGRGNIDRVTIM